MSYEPTLIDQLKALGDPVRLRIMALLPRSANCEHGNNVSQLAEKLAIPQPTISHHLRVLRCAGLVTNKKMCRDVFYWVNAEATAALLAELDPILAAPVPSPTTPATSTKPAPDKAAPIR